MKIKLIILTIVLFASSSSHVDAQKILVTTGHQFFALTVSNVDSASAWYERVFSLHLVKEVKVKENNLHVRILANENLTLELLQLDGTRSLKDCGISTDEGHLRRGFVKVGFYVPDITVAEKFFSERNVKIKYKTFDDKEMKVRSFIAQDLYGNLIQVMQGI